MSHRRTVNTKSPVVKEETAVIVKGPLSLESAKPSNAEEKVPLSSGSDLSNDSRNNVRSLRVKNWKESSFAVGLTEPSWEAERLGMTKIKDDIDGDQPIMFDDDYLPKDTTGCLCCSALVCSYLGAGRVGNMVVLRSSTEWVEEVELDEETGEEKITRYTRPKLHCVMGPL